MAFRISCHLRSVGVGSRILGLQRFYSNFAQMAIKAVLIDLSGTLHIEDDPTPNAVEALNRLRKTNVCIKFVTNTSKESGETLHNRLVKIGFKLERSEIYSSLSAASRFIQDNKLNPFYLVSDDARKDFPEASAEKYDSVAVGLAPDKFNYEDMNKAFNVLLQKDSKLIAIYQGRYYKRKDGLALGPGCFVKGLEFSSGVAPIVIGKPNKYFFESAIPEGIKPNECVMIGDDANDDIAGALNIGMRGILVKTGKYRPEVTIDPPPTVTLENFDEAVSWIEEKMPRIKSLHFEVGA